MDHLKLRNGLDIQDPLSRLTKFCNEEYDYYDGIVSSNPNHIEPLDVLVTVAVNSRVNDAAAVRSVHRGLAASCDPLLAQIPVGADLLDAVYVPQVVNLLDKAVQVPRVLLPVATKVLHRKRPQLIPMLDNVVITHYLSSLNRSELGPKSQDKQHAAAVGQMVLEAFRQDLAEAIGELAELSARLTGGGWLLTPTRVLEILVWTETETAKYYR